MKKLFSILFLSATLICVEPVVINKDVQSQTRYYLNTGTTSPVAPAANAGWNVTTGAIQYRMSEVKDGSTLANNVSASVGAAAVRKVLIDQWVSDPLAAQTITGTLTGQIRYDISSVTSTTGQGFAYLRIISNDGTSIVTEVGTLTTTDLSTTTTNRTMISLNVGTLTINSGERICIDIGWNYSVGTNTTRTAFISTGSSSGTDLPVDNTATAANDPWMEFSDNIILLGTDYYVATTGSDAAAGTIGAPFLTWEKLGNTLVEGDRGWVRGGTYAPTKAMTVYRHCYWLDINGTANNPITISNYQAEVPIYDFAGAVCTEASGNTFAIFMENCDYVTVTGLRTRNIKQVVGGAGVSRGWAISDASTNNTFNYCTVDSMGGTGWVVGNDSHNNVFNYCDSYNNSDPNSTPAWGGADGFSVSSVNSTPTYFNYCRAWWNSDDGFDADFLSVSSTGMDGARSIGGALPNTNFMKLAAGSDLINAGSDVGYGNDVNWFQYVATTRYKGRIF